MSEPTVSQLAELARLRREDAETELAAGKERLSAKRAELSALLAARPQTGDGCEWLLLALRNGQETRLAQAVMRLRIEIEDCENCLAATEAEFKRALVSESYLDSKS